MPGRFVWQVHLRQDVLDDAITELRALPHEVLRQIVEQPLRKQVRGRDNQRYDLRVTATHVAPDSSDLEITVRLKRGWFGRSLVDSFRVTGPPVQGGFDEEPVDQD